jgi:hypothetical protein
MTKVALVLSLSHSGSTLLDLILGGNSRCVGLGEVHNSLSMPRSRLEAKFGEQCTCGRNADSCEFWGPFKHWLSDNFERSAEEKFQALHRHFLDVFGPDKILVDSSKKIRVANIYHGMQDVELNALHLLKDVRAYTVSQIDKNPTSGSKTKHALTAFSKWYRKNRRIQRLVRGKGIPHFQFGYEELCLYPERMVHRICDFLEIDFEDEMLALESRNNHLIAGNPLRQQPEKRRKIVYDDRWLQRNELNGVAFLRSGIMRYNAREVYKNGVDEIWNG